MMRAKVLLLAVALLLGACSPDFRDRLLGSASTFASDVNTFAVLKQAALTQFLWVNDRGSFSRTLSGLGNETTDSIKAVVAARASGKNYSGHIFTDLVEDERGAALDNRTRYGLLATPDKNAGKSYLLLMDLQQASPAGESEEGKNAASGFGEELQYYESTEPKAVDAKWPSPAELARWTRIRLRTPQEASQQIHKMADDFDAGRGR